MPLPLTIAASDFSVLIYVLAALIWVVFQLMARAAKRQPPAKPPAMKRPPPVAARPPAAPPAESPSRPRPLAAPTLEDELKEFMDLLAGRQTEAPARRAPAAAELPRPVRPPPLERAPPAAPARAEQVFQPRPVRAAPPPPRAARPTIPSAARPAAAAPPLPLPETAAAAALPVPEPGVYAGAGSRVTQRLVSPLMRMRWPASAFGQLRGAMVQPARQSPLRRRLQGRPALRQAMISRLVLGPPGGR